MFGDCSATLQIIDDEVARVLHEADGRARATLDENRSKLDALASALVEREEISEKEIVELIGPSVHHDENGEPFTSAQDGELAASDSVSS